MELEGKRVLLSGATGGLGRAIAGELAGQGAVLVLSSSKGDELDSLAESLPGGAVRHISVVADLAEPGAAEDLVERAGDVDGLVANAALPATGRLENFSSEEVQRALRVNFESPILMARALGPKLAEKGDGHLVFIASLAGKVGSPRSSLYNATKFGLRGFALALRDELWGSGVGVSVILPGFIRDAGMFAASGAKSPAGLGTSSPEEVGDGVVSAIERDRVEVQVAPLLQRLGAGFAHRHPQLASRVTRRNAARIAERVSEGQKGKL